MFKINGRKLVSVNSNERKKEMLRVVNRLQSKENISEECYRQVWKAFFYCYWMTDSITAQNALAKQIAAMSYSLKEEDSKLFISCFWKQIGREWNGLDRYRLDKFYLFMLEMIRVMVDLWWRKGRKLLLKNDPTSLMRLSEDWRLWVKCMGVLEWEKGPDSLVAYVLEKILIVCLEVISKRQDEDEDDKDDDKDDDKSCYKIDNQFSFILDPFLKFLECEKAKNSTILLSRFQTNIWRPLIDGTIGATIVNWKTGIEEEVILPTNIIMTREMVLKCISDLVQSSQTLNLSSMLKDLLNQLLIENGIKSTASTATSKPLCKKIIGKKMKKRQRDDDDDDEAEADTEIDADRKSKKEKSNLQVSTDAADTDDVLVKDNVNVKGVKVKGSTTTTTSSSKKSKKVKWGSAFIHKLRPKLSVTSNHRTISPEKGILRESNYTPPPKEFIEKALKKSSRK